MICEISTAPRRTAAISLLLLAAFATRAQAQQQTLQKAGDDDIDKRVAAIMPQVITWRRDFHEHPELGNREVRTAKIVADYLRSLGIDVREGVATTGVVGVLRGGKPGGVVALRADMDALPVTEMVDLPFKSTVRCDVRRPGRRRDARMRTRRAHGDADGRGRRCSRE